MKEQKQKPGVSSRRSFFSKGILAGAIALFGFKPAQAASDEEGDMVKMLTADGKLVEVPRKSIPKRSGKVVSNQELFEWREKHKK